MYSLCNIVLRKGGKNMSSYEESLSWIKDCDDSLFPDWLFKPFFNDFNDDYYEKSFAEDKIQLQAKKIRRRYNDFFQWQEAMSIYYDYMQTLVEKWGSMSVIKNSIEAGTLPDFVPTKPKLKNNKKNKFYLKTGFVPSRRIVELPVSDEELIAIARQSFPNQMGEDLDPYEDYKMTKVEKRIYRKMEEKSQRMNRRANMYRDIGNSRGTDFIVEYLNQAKQGVYSSSGIRKKDAFDIENMSLADKAKEYVRRLNTPQDELDAESATNTTIEAGRVVDRAQFEQMEVYKVLYEEGFNVIGSMKGKLDKRSIKMIRTQIGAVEPMTKKEMRKLKKRNRKDQKKIQRRKDEDANLSNLLLSNKIKEKGYGGSLSTMFADLFPDYYKE